jgi:hypothetical protein
MKKILLILPFLSIYFGVFAGTGIISPPENTAVNNNSNKQWLFKPLSSNDVSLEVERIDANVLVYLFSQNMKNVDMIYVEKSKDPTMGFQRCKTIKVSDHLVKSKNYINVVDDSPSDPNSDNYYRIRTVTATGATKIYPSIVLAPLMTIDGETVDNGK